MIAAFTIVARNYISLALILADSYKQHNSSDDFFIVIADAFNVDDFKGQIPNYSKYNFLSLADIDLPESKLLELAFKYNVTEFCTSIKPFCFNVLFKKGFDKLYYFDPDIYIFGSMQSISLLLDKHSIVLTPHICFPEPNYSGLFKEGMLLNSGAFNLGFLALANTSEAKSFITWWEGRLLDKCYIDVIDGYFTDQKWVNFVPSMFDSYFVTRSLSLNVALWNLHERKVIRKEDQFFIVSRFNNLHESPTVDKELVFFHFSNFKFGKHDDEKNFIPVEGLNEVYSDIRPLLALYMGKLREYDFNHYANLYKYKFAFFENGVPIQKAYRRFFRTIAENNLLNLDADPFQCTKNSFYRVLENNKVLIADSQFLSTNNTSQSDFQNKIRKINRFFRVFKWIVGFSRYATFCRLAIRYFRYENQVFLISEGKSAPFYNDTEFNELPQKDEGN